jgi:hypothetical protein
MADLVLAGKKITDGALIISRCAYWDPIPGSIFG